MSGRRKDPLATNVPVRTESRRQGKFSRAASTLVIPLSGPRCAELPNRGVESCIDERSPVEAPSRTRGGRLRVMAVRRSCRQRVGLAAGLSSRSPGRKAGLSRGAWNRFCVERGEFVSSCARSDGMLRRRPEARPRIARAGSEQSGGRAKLGRGGDRRPVLGNGGEAVKNTDSNGSGRPARRSPSCRSGVSRVPPARSSAGVVGTQRAYLRTARR